MLHTAGNATAVQPVIAAAFAVKLTVPALGAGAPATPVTVAVNATGTPNSAEVAGLADTTAIVGATSVIT
ncbi:MAG: hypothetical protein ACJ72N_07815 [Labedaea sp.]